MLFPIISSVPNTGGDGAHHTYSARRPQANTRSQDSVNFAWSKSVRFHFFSLSVQVYSFHLLLRCPAKAGSPALENILKLQKEKRNSRRALCLHVWKAAVLVRLDIWIIYLGMIEKKITLRPERC